MTDYKTQHEIAKTMIGGNTANAYYQSLLEEAWRNQAKSANGLASPQSD